MNQALKVKVKDLWDKFWSGGISNPLNAIEQITYLLFIKQLDEYDRHNHTKTLKGSIFSGKYIPPGGKEEDAVDKNTLRWSEFKTLPGDEMLLHVQSKVFPFIKQLNGNTSNFTKHMNNAAFLVPSGRLLTEAVKIIDEIYTDLNKENRFIDAQGDFYEYLLSELNQAGKNGQFRTPPHIIELIVELVAPALGQKIADPACGTAGFLIGAYKFIITNLTSLKNQQLDENGFLRGVLADKLKDSKLQKLYSEDAFFGFDIDPTMIRIGLMNLMMHGVSDPQIDYKNTIGKNYNEDSKYDVVLANPPFTGNIDKADISDDFTIITLKTELLFLERIYKMLRVGGTAGVIVPQGVLFGSGIAYKDTRKMLMEKCELKAVISMPSGVFRPYAGVATAILIFKKGGETKDVWFYEMKSDGLSLDDKRNKLFNSKNERDFGDLHLIIDEYRKKEKSKDRTKQNFAVPKAEIIINDYDLSINKYQIESFLEIKYDKPKDIIKKLVELEKDISHNITELERIFK